MTMDWLAEALHSIDSSIIIFNLRGVLFIVESINSWEITKSVLKSSKNIGRISSYNFESKNSKPKLLF